MTDRNGAHAMSGENVVSAEQTILGNDYEMNGTSEKQDNDAEPRSLTAKRLHERIVQQNFRCYFTGEVLEPETASIEHLQPLSRGGLSHIRNVVWVRAEINRMKGTMTPQEFVEWCGRVWRHHSNRVTQEAAQEA